MHFYNFNIGDYAKKTQHLTNEEDLAYRRLLDLYYDLEVPITHGLATLSRRLRVSEKSLQIILDEFFPEGRNKHADEEIAKYYAYLAKQKSNGIKGGRPKNKPTDNPPVSQNNPPGALPRTINQQPITKESKAMSNSPEVILSNGKQKFRADAETLLTFLNEKTGRSYRPLKVNLELVADRLKEGATVQDCKSLIAKKVREWKGTEMEQYLRPATLFNRTKFAQYIGELCHD